MGIGKGRYTMAERTFIAIKPDGVKRNLADFGFGVTQLVSMLLQIDINISENQVECGREYIEPKMEQKNELDEKSKKKTVVKNICRVNYTFKNSYIVLEEPESHLHPYYQSKLTDMLLDAYERYNIHPSKAQRTDPTYQPALMSYRLRL